MSQFVWRSQTIVLCFWSSSGLVTGLFAFLLTWQFLWIASFESLEILTIRRRRSSNRRKVSKGPEFRINRRIRVHEVRLIDHEGTNHGVVPTGKAMQMAEDAELDLVEVAPNSKPPVCRIMDYGKFAYEKTKREREARKLQKQIEIKNICIYLAHWKFI